MMCVLYACIYLYQNRVTLDQYVLFGILFLIHDSGTLKIRMLKSIKIITHDKFNEGKYVIQEIIIVRLALCCICIRKKKSVEQSVKKRRYNHDVTTPLHISYYVAGW